MKSKTRKFSVNNAREHRIIQDARSAPVKGDGRKKEAEVVAKICPNSFDDCAIPTDCARTRCRYSLVPPIGCLHFVGFRDDRYWAAVRAFGLPDIIHRVWDARAKAEVGPDDVVLFAVGDEYSPVAKFTWDDS